MQTFNLRNFIQQQLRRLPVLLLLACCSSALGQDTTSVKDTVDFYEMSIEDLQKLKATGVPSEIEKLINSLIGVASKKALPARESPAIITLITEEEIRKSGARDLTDVLNMVPGIDFGVDVEGVVGLGMRGNWAHEGKILLLLDGQEMNENLFGTLQFGNHFDVDQIKRIEIIRGPGSAIYGGYAEYGVINIITQDGADLKGFRVIGTYGQMKSDYARRNAHLAAGFNHGNLDVSLKGFIGQGQRSDRTFTDFYGGSYSMKGNSALDPKNLNFGLSWKGKLNLRYIYDQYETVAGDGYEMVRQPYALNFTSQLAEINYIWKPIAALTITPKINYKSQSPWNTPGDSLEPAFDKTTTRITGNLTTSWNITRKINLVAGAEVFSDEATDNSDSSFFSNGKSSVSYLNKAFFVQGVIRTRPLNFILGARYDEHNEYGSNFVPRVGLTKRHNRFHFKLLYSNAFRAPGIENINLQDSAGISPERTRVTELELGYQLNKKSIVTVNLFDIATTDAIVYYFDDSLETDAYHNAGATGSRGAELEYKLKDRWGYLNLNYAFYTSAGIPNVPDYEVPGRSDVLLAFPAHRLNLNVGYSVTRKFSVAATASLRTERYAYTSIDTVGTAVVSRLPPNFQLNLFLRYQDLFVNGLTVGIGVYDVFDQGIQYIQPYNSYHAPLPGTGTELMVKLSYHFTRKSS